MTTESGGATAPEAEAASVSLATADVMRYLRVDDAGDAAMIEGLVAAAVGYVYAYARRERAETLAEDIAGLSEHVKIAALMLTANWYENREGLTTGGMGVRASETPFGVRALLDMDSARRF